MGTALFLFVPARGMERVTRLARTHSERNYGKETRAAWKLNNGNTKAAKTVNNFRHNSGIMHLRLSMPLCMHEPSPDELQCPWLLIRLLLFVGLPLLTLEAFMREVLGNPNETRFNYDVLDAKV